MIRFDDERINCFLVWNLIGCISYVHLPIVLFESLLYHIVKGVIFQVERGSVNVFLSLFNRERMIDIE